MKHRLILLFLLTATTSFSQIKVACVGNSITFGSGIKDRDQDAYPAQLQKLLGEEYQVKNFGLGGRTMLKSGDRPYSKEPLYTEAKQWQADIYIIKLGTNDTKTKNWINKDQFYGDYLAMVKELKQASSKAKIILCSPVWVAKDGKWTINNLALLEKDGIIDCVKKIKKKERTLYVDLYPILKDHPEYFSDGIHPNVAGARAIAQTIFPVVKRIKVKK